MILKNKNKGFTLVEVLVSVALISLAATFMIMTYSNVLEEKRQEADLEVLNGIDDTLRQVFMQRDAFDEAEFKSMMKTIQVDGFNPQYFRR